jgi:protease-4
MQSPRFRKVRVCLWKNLALGMGVVMEKGVEVKAGEPVVWNGQLLRVCVEPGRPPRPRGRWFSRSLLTASLLLNLLWCYRFFAGGYAEPAVAEVFVDGEEGAEDRIAVISFTGTISPPFTERWLRLLKRAKEDETVRGVVLSIDSPGGFVADSHQLYRRIQELAEVKPVYVSMKRLAASGGYYIAVAAGERGRIFAEPTTWTGSIGVIVARYNASELAGRAGVRVEPLVTGPLKDSLNPFRDLTARETEVWDAILKDAFDRFVRVIDEGRAELDEAAVRKLATGQIYTAQQALENHLVDELGYEEDAVVAMAASLGLKEWETFEYRSTPGLVDALLGIQGREPSITEQLAEAAIPRAQYLCSWFPVRADFGR